MNVYDFDKTIYKGDSTVDFWKFSIKSKPSLLKYLPRQVWGLIKYLFGFCDKKGFKEYFYSFLGGISQPELLVNQFWEKNHKKIAQWYTQKRDDEDVVISASAEFLLKPECELLGIKHLIASDVDIHSGKYNSKNCRGENKPAMLKDSFPDSVIDEFYSDSLSDTPLANIANKSYIVQNEQIIPWKEYKPSLTKKLFAMFFTRQFFLFVVVGVVNTINGIIFSYIYSFLFSWLYSLIIPPGGAVLIPSENVSFIVGYITSLTISYILNSTFVFKEKFTFTTYIKFAISYIPNFIIQNLLLLLFYNIIHLPYLISLMLAAAVAVPVTFIMMKIFAFKKKSRV